MSAADYGSLPFDEQIEFFRQKLNLPTERWDDLLGAAHDRAFVVAGAMQADLLADLRAAVDKAIAQGTTLDEYRRDFDQIVAKHGWTGWTGEGTKAGEAWRTKVTYATNLRTSYAAGRYRQLQDIKRRRPYWRYVHNDTVLHPRPHHVAIDGLILPADDPFWDRAFPPNGFNCFPAGTKVATPHGWLAVETLRRGDRVIGGSGDVKPVAATHKRAFHGNVVRVVTKEVDVSATPNHRFLTLRGWIRADNLQVGEVLVQILQAPAIDGSIGNVKQPNSARSQNGVAFPRHRSATTLREALDTNVQVWDKSVNPVRGGVVVMDGIHPPLLQRINHHLFALRRGCFGVRVCAWVFLVFRYLRESHLCANFRAPRRRRVFKFFGGTHNAFVCLFGLAKPIMATLCGLLDGCFSHRFSRNFPALVVVDPLGFDCIASPARLNAKPFHESHNSALIEIPAQAQLANREALVDVEGSEGFTSGAPLDRFDSLEDFVSWAGVHCRLSVVSSVAMIPYNGTVYNLSVEDDESYCVLSSVVHNCRCRVESLAERDIKREGLEVGEAPEDWQADRGWDYAPGASVADELNSLVREKQKMLPGQIAKDFAEAMAGRHAAASPGSTQVAAMSIVNDFVQSVLENRQAKQEALIVTGIPDEFAMVADRLEGVSTTGKSFALDHDYLLHIFDRHGGASESMRGQVPVTSADLAAIAANLALGRDVRPGDPPRAKNGAARIASVFEIGGYRLDVIFEVRRRVLVPVTVWKRPL